MKKRILRLTAHTVALSMVYQLAFPLCAHALTTGPSQPEVQSFEPVGTTEMVDMFTGDFNYNIPLMDVEGYPINIAYHSGVGMEQEASWVGLGWNINPGEINRTVRGVPDDFNGDKIEKGIYIQPENDYRIGMGGSISLEIVGFEPNKYGANLSLSVGQYLNYNNYKGMSIGFNVGATISTPVASAGINMGIGSQSGADVDLHAGLTLPMTVGNDNGGTQVGMSATGGTGFNSRSGLKDFSFGFGVSMKAITGYKNTGKKDACGDDIYKIVSSGIPGNSFGSSIPIGLQNYVPVVTNSSVHNSFQFQAKLGTELMYLMPNLYLNVMISHLKYNTNGDRNSYGYLYSENAADSDVLDFSREKDGVYNRTLQNLPASSSTYDIYSVSGQGTGGMFRPFRNDIGTIYDPRIESTDTSNDVQLEVGLGNLFEAGGDLNFYENKSKSGPWKQLNYNREVQGSLYEKVFFKQGGEMTYNQQQAAPQLFNPNPAYLSDDMHTLIGKGNAKVGVLPPSYNGASIYSDNIGTIDRTSRANLITYRTASEAKNPDVFQNRKITSYNDLNNRFYDPQLSNYNRYAAGTPTVNDFDNKPDHISEFSQTLPDGRRYIYGIPAMNHVTSERAFSVKEQDANLINGLVKINQGDNSPSNNKGRDHYYSVTNTPSYAHSYLLTSVLSNDYVDILGDGVTDDDLGTYVKFNYRLTDNDYRWRAPYQKDSTTDSAQYNPGFWSDQMDGKGSYMIGSRQQWHLRSIESKNYVAEFYISPRHDGLGTKDRVLDGNSKISIPGVSLKGKKNDYPVSYELDSIKLFNKHDRYINQGNAIPVKTVVFKYNYSLCPGIPNTQNAGEGKLSLQKIFIKYGKSEKNLLSPYVFTYSTSNPSYDFAAKDCWGNYKPNVPAISNYEFPYSNQPSTPADSSNLISQVSAWNLSSIKLPSGGKINVQYESDDYAFVQDRRAMQMFHITGVGNSPASDHKAALYEDLNNINDYVYFKRQISKEDPGRSLQNNYLENQDLLYYSFNLDITGKGKYEHIKGYAKIDEVGICTDDANYGFVKLKRDKARSLSLHPATIYGLNMARYYLPHVLYPGYKEGDNSTAGEIMEGMLAAATELGTIWQNPFERFIVQGKGRNIRIEKSWIRLQSPGLCKKGGGLRVRQLTLDDNWHSMSANPDNASYGKQYDYTVRDSTYGTISSGVASYEPMVGGDENPFHLPVKYTADAGRLLPAIDFFQEEPFGESFFPSPMVGYSSIKVKSIHASEGGSSQSEDEYLFYTAREFPLVVDYTQREAPDPVKSKTLRRKYQEEKMLQGYVLRFNDMHGKPKAMNNYVIHTDGTYKKSELITGVKYNYNKDNEGKLSNKVKALSRVRGQKNTYEIQEITLGQDMDFTVDSRERDMRSYNRNIALNLNVVLWAFAPIPIPTAFFPDKEDQQIFRSLVSTKIIQQYGILKSIESFDHGAVTIIENQIFDAETGGVLLSKTNNQYNDPIYDLKYPAHLAYQGMGPAYVNTNFSEAKDTLIVDSSLNGNLLSPNKDKYQIGDELLVSYISTPAILFTPAVTTTYKMWVTGMGLHTYKTVDSSWQYPNPAYTTIDSTLHTPLPYYTYTTVMHYPQPYYTLDSIQINTEPVTYSYDSIKHVPLPYATYDSTAHYPPTYYTYDTIHHPATGTPTLTLDTINQSICVVKVLPRYKSASYWPQQPVKYSQVSVKILRSGHRNDLNQYVAQAQLTASPYQGTVASLFAGTSSNLLAISANTFTDSAVAYDQFRNTLIDTANNISISGFNPYVLGYRGNFRPLSSYAPLAGRSYATGHARFDGTFSLPSLFWSFTNGYAPVDCSVPLGVLSPISAGGNASWKQASMVTKYDVQGNALEERDAIGNYSSAQYGYNKSLPVAVASNARQQSFTFEGFEDYNMLLPQTIRFLYASSAFQGSPFAPLFSALANVSAYNYQSSPANIVFSRYGQSFNLKSLATASDSLVITREASHTGFFSLKANLPRDLVMDVALSNKAVIQKFSLETGKKYLVNLWVKSSSGGAIASQFYTSTGNGNISMQLKSGNIEGWYLLEGSFDLTNGEFSTVKLHIPGDVFVDDIRMLPIDANMKSFVYDPITFKLMAQMDENNMATFYEYDQEGLLVRVKKETERGIMTISESRRANAKQL